MVRRAGASAARLGALSAFRAGDGVPVGHAEVLAEFDAAAFAHHVPGDVELMMGLKPESGRYQQQTVRAVRPQIRSTH